MLAKKWECWAGDADINICDLESIADRKCYEKETTEKRLSE